MKHLRDEQSLVPASGTLFVAKSLATVAMALSAVVAARSLGPAGRGILALQITVTSLTALLITLGTTISCRTALVEKSDRVILSDYVGLSMVLALFAGLVSFLVASVVLPIAGVDLVTADAVAVALHGVGLLAGSAALNALYAYGHFRVAAALEVGLGLVALGLTCLAAQMATTSVRAYVGALALAQLLPVLGALARLRANGHAISPRCSGRSWRRLIRSGLPAMGLAVSQSAAYRFDRYLVGIFLTPTAVGLYSVAATFAELLRLVPTSIGQVLLHRVATAGSSASQVAQSYKKALLLSAAPVAAFLVIGDSLLVLVFGDAYAPSATPFRILVIGEIAVASFLLDSSVLAGRNVAAGASLCAGGGLAVITILDVWLIKRHGIEGAAWASLAGYVFMAVAARRLTIRSDAPPLGETGYDIRVNSSP